MQSFWQKQMDRYIIRCKLLAVCISNETSVNLAILCGVNLNGQCRSCSTSGREIAPRAALLKLPLVSKSLTFSFYSKLGCRTNNTRVVYWL